MAAIGAPEIRLQLQADHVTGDRPQTVVLAAGDTAHLDAGTALAEWTDAQVRRLTLLEGAAFFEVRAEARPFEVVAGDATVRALGTAFEVVRDAAGLHVAVAEGRVEVDLEGQAWRLAAGERWAAPPAGAVTTGAVRTSSIAAWRRDRLVADGMTLRAVAAAIDRRLAGTIFVRGSALGERAVTGSFDLADPLSALRAAAAPMEARVLALPPLLTLVLPAGQEKPSAPP